MGTSQVNSNPTTGTTASRVPPAQTTCCCPVCSGLQCLDRTRYFSGQLLTEADLNNDQAYWLAKNRLHNRYLSGWGVVCGMQVVCGECDGWVTVESGYAIDPCGNDVIVCGDQNFNVAQAIQQCCAPAQKQAPNCSPLRYNPSPTCQDAIQEWCVTIQYQEQPSRLVTPLTSSTSQSSCGCGCSSSNGNGKSKSNLMTSGSCRAASSAPPPATTVPAGACEPTRVVEGFQLGVIPASEVAARASAGNPNSLSSHWLLCIEGLAVLLAQAPTFDANTTPQSAYQATCTYLALAKRALANAEEVTLCSLLSYLSAITIPSGADVATYTGIVAMIKDSAVIAFFNCFCLTFVPPCPAPACDNRIVLACLTVQNGKVINICHYPGRNQLITLQTLGYWLGPLGLNNLGTALADAFNFYCCQLGQKTQRAAGALFPSVYYNESVNTAGLATQADFSRIASHYLAQTLGANIVNAVAPGTQAVDLRPMVNTPTEQVTESLRRQGFKSLTLQSVDGDPAWSADALANSSQFAPAAVTATSPILVYTVGDTAVGFEVIDPTTAKLQDLQNQITALQNQLNPPPGAADASKPQQPK